MFTGLGPAAATSPRSKPNLPRFVRFSDRSLLRVVHGRPGKRAFAGGACVLKPAAVEEDDNPPPEAAIIRDNNTEGALAEKTAATREVRWTAARQRRAREPQVHHGKTNFTSTAFIVPHHTAADRNA